MLYTIFVKKSFSSFVCRKEYLALHVCIQVTSIKSDHNQISRRIYSEKLQHQKYIQRWPLKFNRWEKQLEI